MMARARYQGTSRRGQPKRKKLTGQRTTSEPFRTSEQHFQNPRLAGKACVFRRPVSTWAAPRRRRGSSHMAAALSRVLPSSIYRVLRNTQRVLACNCVSTRTDPVLRRSVSAECRRLIGDLKTGRGWTVRLPLPCQKPRRIGAGEGGPGPFVKSVARTGGYGYFPLLLLQLPALKPYG